MVIIRFGYKEGDRLVNFIRYLYNLTRIEQMKITGKYQESTVQGFPTLNEIRFGRQGSSIDGRLSCRIVTYLSASIERLVIERSKNE